MNIIESIKVAVSAILANKMRSLLTMLGIIIGISSVITVVAIGEGSQSMIDKEFQQFGAGKAYLSLNWQEDYSERDFMTKEDVEALKESFAEDIKSIVPSMGSTGKVNARNKELEISLRPADENVREADKLKLVEGRFFIAEDIKAARNLVMLEKDSAKEIFGRTNVVGDSLDLKLEGKNVSLSIVGVYEKPKSAMSAMAGGSGQAEAMLPYSSLGKMSNVDIFFGAQISFEDDVNIDKVKDKMVLLIERRHDAEGKDQYMMQTAEEELSSINKITGIITLVIGAIAAISLLVGGIGVMNIMFVSVTERTREIGIRKAIGAKRKDILLQFLVESVIVSGIGGVIGTILGILFSLIISVFIKIPPSISIRTIAIAWLFSAGVGIFFGIYPANKASKLDPIDALRYE